MKKPIYAKSKRTGTTNGRSSFRYPYGEGYWPRPLYDGINNLWKVILAPLKKYCIEHWRQVYKYSLQNKKSEISVHSLLQSESIDP